MLVVVTKFGIVFLPVLTVLMLVLLMLLLTLLEFVNVIVVTLNPIMLVLKVEAEMNKTLDPPLCTLL